MEWRGEDCSALPADIKYFYATCCGLSFFCGAHSSFFWAVRCLLRRLLRCFGLLALSHPGVLFLNLCCDSVDGHCWLLLHVLSMCCGSVLVLLNTLCLYEEYCFWRTVAFSGDTTTTPTHHTHQQHHTQQKQIDEDDHRGNKKGREKEYNNL